MTVMLGAYRVVTSVLEPLVPRLLRMRVRQGKEDPVRWREKLGETPVPRPAGSLVWMHGVSVGEALSLLPLIDRLRAERADLSILVTTGTRTAAEMMARRLPEGVI
ncbi:MAG: 3-deoxy-D-manno-octulosonic acid transferase, partial [Brevundimonas sp.]